MNKVQKIKLRKQIFMYSMAVIVLLFTAFILNKWVEALAFTIAHILIRPQFKLQYHSMRTMGCVLITSGVIFFGISFVLPLSISLFSVIPIVYVISWVGYREAYINRLEAKLERAREDIVSKTPTEIILEKCAKFKISERDTKIAIMYYVNRKPPKQIWQWLCDNNEYMEYDSVYKLLNRLNKKLK